ncbi:MAG: hypothetical protein FWF36_01880 [Propionibacteriaceae bacterium]|nr:hypothetical protein [Propionibacteriaceae bacterium]
MAYASRNRDALRDAGLNYDALAALHDPLAVGVKIVEAACGAISDGTIEDAEDREIVAEVVAWIIQQPGGVQPDEAVRKTIEQIIARTVLTEVSASIYDKAVPFDRRRALEQSILDTAAELAAQARLTSTGATAQEIGKAIEDGIRDLGRIYKVKS